MQWYYIYDKFQTAANPNAVSIDYAGYSTVFCDVNGDGTKELILGMPRADYYRGSIRVHFGTIKICSALLH